MPKRAIVLGGGGARGPYQIGVWQALTELGIGYDIVTGSSVGALNAALMVQRDYEVAKELWEKINFEDVVALSGKVDINTPEGRQSLRDSFGKDGHLGFDVSPLEQMVREVVDEERFRASPIDFGLVTVRFPTFRAEQLVKSEIPEGKLVDYLMASASYFPLFQRRVIDGIQYIDGAFNDNLPAELAVRCGAEELVVVDLAGSGFVHRLKKEVPVIYIRCRWALGQILEFDASTAKEKHLLGYYDTLKAYQKLEGSSYAFYPGESKLNGIRLRDAFRAIRGATGISILRQYQRVPHSHEAARYHDKRFYRYTGDKYTLGRAITAIAEMAGELLGVSPYRLYTFDTFNDILWNEAKKPDKNTANVSGPWPQGESATLAPIARTGARRVIRRFYHMLHRAYTTGNLHNSMWGLSALFSKEFLVAYYLLALQISGGYVAEIGSTQ